MTAQFHAREVVRVALVGPDADALDGAISAEDVVSALADHDLLVSDDPGGTEPCDQCGRFYATVYHLPDEVWALIHDRAPGGLLCPGCADRRAAEAGAVLYWEAQDGMYPRSGKGGQRLLVTDEIQAVLDAAEEAVRCGWDVPRLYDSVAAYLASRQA